MTFYVGDSLKTLLSIKLKTREDNLSDQVSRILVTKILVVASMGLSLVWFHSETRCIPPTVASSHIPPQFLHRGCWAKGFYIYPHLSSNMRRSAYYGIPIELQMDGYRTHNPSQLCQAKTRERKFANRNKNACTPMTREYFTQYQWMPMYLLLLSSIFYFPYILFRMVNSDIIKLRCNVKNMQMEVDQIVYMYFTQELNTIRRNRLRVVLNYGVKCLYVFSNIIAMSFMHHLMNNRFYSYGIDWMLWSQGNSTERYDFETRTQPTPGNRLLPIFGLCDIYDVRLDSTVKYANKLTVVCEMSSHAVYQHTLVVVWLLLVFSNVSAIIGLFYHLGNHLRMLHTVKSTGETGLISQRYMTIRELEYLECIKNVDVAMYSKVVKSLDDNLLSTDTPMNVQFQQLHINGIA